MSKTEPHNGNREHTDSCQRNGVGGNGGKKGKGIVKEHVWMTHRHEQEGGNGLWEGRMGQDRGGQRGKNWEVSRVKIKNEKKKNKWKLGLKKDEIQWCGKLGVEGLSKKEKDSWAWTTGWWLLGGGGIRGLNGNGKNIIKIIY